MNIHQCLRARYPAFGLLAIMAVCGLRSAHLFAAPLRVDSESPMIGSTPLVFPPPAPKEGMVADAGSIAAAVRDLSNANVGTRQAARLRGCTGLARKVNRLFANWRMKEVVRPPFWPDA